MTKRSHVKRNERPAGEKSPAGPSIGHLRRDRDRRRHERVDQADQRVAARRPAPVPAGGRDVAAGADHADPAVHPGVHHAQVLERALAVEPQRVGRRRARGERQARVVQLGAVERGAALQRDRVDVRAQRRLAVDQNGWPAASLTPVIGVDGSGAASAGAGPPGGAKVTEWKPLIRQRTRSPRWIVIVRRKYSFASPKACWNFAPCPPNGPAWTVFVAAPAAAGTARAATTTSAPAIRACMVPPRGFDSAPPQARDARRCN